MKAQKTRRKIYESAKNTQENIWKRKKHAEKYMKAQKTKKSHKNKTKKS
jgi:hypothetical protein